VWGEGGLPKILVTEVPMEHFTPHLGRKITTGERKKKKREKCL
jgi:hypothetical protein